VAETAVAEANGAGLDASITILHHGDKYVVRFLKCSNAPSAVVCFEFWKAQPSLEGEPAAEGFFRNRGINFIGILAADNDWFQHPEINAALAAIRAATEGYDLIGYGGSMGAYAGINFADRLGLRRVIAICPQYSIDEKRVPTELRWRAEAARIMANGGFSQDRIDEVSPPARGWIIYDPGGVDRHHADAIQSRHHLMRVPVCFARHHEMRMLQQCNLLTPMLAEMLADRFDAADFRRRLRIARRQSAVFWVNLSAALLERKHFATALAAIRQARALPHPEPGEIDLQEARVSAALGNHAGALALAAPWTNDPAWSWAAVPLVDHVHAAMAVAPRPLVESARRGWTLREWWRRKQRNS
jgi:hypothetical protein